MNRKLTMLAAIVSAVVFTTSVHAGTIAYDFAAGQVTDQAFPGTVGMDFDVVAATGISVTSLGVWDDSIDGTGLTNAFVYRVAIFDRNTTSIVAGLDTTISSADTTTVVGGNVLKAITPVVLPVGNYSIVYDANVPLENDGSLTQNSGVGLITFINPTGGRFYSGLLFNYPDTVTAQVYVSGTFEFEAVPEPNTFLLIGLGSLGLAVARRRRRKRSRS